MRSKACRAALFGNCPDEASLNPNLMGSSVRAQQCSERARLCGPAHSHPPWEHESFSQIMIVLPGGTIVLSRSTYLFPDAQSSSIGARIFSPTHNSAPREHDCPPPLHNRALGEHESFFRCTIMLRPGIIVSSRSTIVIAQGTKVHGQHDRMY